MDTAISFLPVSLECCKDFKSQDFIKEKKALEKKQKEEAEQAVLVRALPFSRAAWAYFYSVGLGRQQITSKNDPEPRGVIFPKCQPISIRPDPIQVQLHFLQTPFVHR